MYDQITKFYHYTSPLLLYLISDMDWINRILCEYAIRPVGGVSVATVLPARQRLPLTFLGMSGQPHSLHVVHGCVNLLTNKICSTYNRYAIHAMHYATPQHCLSKQSRTIMHRYDSRVKCLDVALRNVQNLFVKTKGYIHAVAPRW